MINNYRKEQAMLLSGKVALITGASRGIGAAIAKMFAENGASVAVNFASNKEAAEKVVQEIDKINGKAIAIQANVSNPEEVEEMIAATEKLLGPIDILVINAAIHFPVKPFVHFEWEEFSDKLNNEMKAAFFPVKSAIKSMMERRTGSIIAVSSSLSHKPSPGFCAHGSAKSALDSFMKYLAQELGPYGIRVNVIAPGLTETDATAFMPLETKQKAAYYTPLKRNGVPEDIAGAALMLASPAASYISGAYLPVDGGSLMF